MELIAGLTKLTPRCRGTEVAVPSASLTVGDTAEKTEQLGIRNAGGVRKLLPLELLGNLRA